MPDVTGTNYILAADLSGVASIVQSPTNGARLPLGTNVVVNYVLQAATNLSAPVVWLDLATNTLDPSGVWQFTDSQATNFTQQFYRPWPAP